MEKINKISDEELEIETTRKEISTIKKSELLEEKERIDNLLSEFK